ncbi:Homocysteine S-methyltransferase family protein [Coccidioides posadasii C735 delta SOWgp]|nr:Homocysteine S-methyltransferase family protein [Coccidioides posadasii C735 delta SOWgp]EER27760.1 Homocysteine S-methyltransferase family protein [Coccidioides posadasii C735 delta SOWgp]KMM67674.1 homocysteine S-methyltransferase [Coccidioides posadasii RMSCC 3488]|eukprot:XP_003069905.1 Homocysteine S-methyltransferase family protein [Coccidioides posadasii C735 delta SOWgp]
MGTVLEEPPYGFTFSAQTPLWSSHLLLSHPTTLSEIHRSYVDAGADIVLTATYQASFEGFARTAIVPANVPADHKQDERHGHATYRPMDATRYMRSAIPLAYSSFNFSSKPPRVALSLGPYGATMCPVSAEYTGIYPEEMSNTAALEAWHAKRLEVYMEDPETWRKIEFLGFETVRRWDEVLAIRGAMGKLLQIAESGQSRKWWISGVFPQEDIDEEDVRRWTSAAFGSTSENGLHPWGIGVNCTRLENIERIVDIMEDELGREKLTDNGERASVGSSWSSRPWLVLYPDGTQGEIYDPTLKTWVKKDEEEITESWPERCWRIVNHTWNRNAWNGILVGGCCRTRVHDIRALRERIDSAWSGS